jgi:hypothetical protein
MRNAVIAVLLVAGAPGLLLPAGIELRMCFCGIVREACCDAPVERGCPRCQRAAWDARGALHATTESRCPGCVQLSVPSASPATSRTHAPAVHLAAAAPSAELAAPPASGGDLALIPSPVLRHPPPGQRNLPLLI